MTTRWEITKAVRVSDLPSPARLIMLVLADVAEVGTAEIPEKFTPSLTVLANETGLARSTVAAYLIELETGGWVTRTRPSTADSLGRGERTRYQLSIPEGSPRDGLGSPVTGLPLVQEADHPSPGDGQPSPPTGRRDRSSYQSQIKDRSSPNRPDIEEICEYLADKIVANGSRRPRITPEWRNQARLLLDKDHRTVEQVKKAIDWCQADPFWCTNVLSMPKLREKYDQLRLAAQRPRGRSPDLVEVNGHKLRPETAQRLADRARFEAMDAANAQKAIGQ